MDARRLLTPPLAALTLSGCALIRPVLSRTATIAASPSDARSAAVQTVPSVVFPIRTEPAAGGPRPYAAEAETASADSPPADEALRPGPGMAGPRAIAAANAAARVASRADAFVGGVQVFAFAPGRIYEVWTAPLRVTTLTLAPGEAITAMAAGDTVRWQIGQTASGSGASARVHVLVKPLETGLETNLVLATNRRVYLVQLRSGGADVFNAAVAWDPEIPGPMSAIESRSETADPATLAGPAGPLNARYRIEGGRRPPPWTPSAVLDDGVRTFIVFDPADRGGVTPALFVIAQGEAELVNYRLVGGLMVVDRLFDRAELRVSGRRPRGVRIVRTGEGAR